MADRTIRARINDAEWDAILHLALDHREVPAAFVAEALRESPLTGPAMRAANRKQETTYPEGDAP